ncbi:MAG: GNAT family N-acetyltransferase [Lachnospiraceae bacterium]|nr:GNAT family N-acetyltransferase [Lachnospiraceae bacterium]
MITILRDPRKAGRLFEGWNETLITSCLQQVMGKIYVTDQEDPKAAFALVGCFGFYGGEPDRELVAGKPEGFVIMVPQDERWAKLIEEVYPDSNRVTRYAIRKDTHFDTVKLRENLRLLPEGYELKAIDGDLYDRCLSNPETADYVSSFEDKEHFLRDGRGIVILKDGEIVSGASSYSRYREGIEIEVSTTKSERRKHLALVVCSALILRCLEEGLYPSWDAHNMNSVHLAEKLGYEFDREYFAYEVDRTKRTH